jgi:uncharacterized repeat protein (TIGR03803 family)
MPLQRAAVGWCRSLLELPSVAITPKTGPVPAAISRATNARVKVAEWYKGWTRSVERRCFHSFTGPDGSYGQGNSQAEGVILDAAGNLYGATPIGGTENAGVVYEIDTAGIFSVL